MREKGQGSSTKKDTVLLENLQLSESGGVPFPLLYG